jgi:hypothetical protein
MYERVYVGTSIVLESSDFRNRIVVEVTENPNNDKERPYNVRFYNIGRIRNDFAPIELVHGSSGYVWIEPGQYVTHNTGVRVPFTLRDNNKEPIVRVEINEYTPDL